MIRGLFGLALALAVLAASHTTATPQFKKNPVSVTGALQSDGAKDQIGNGNFVGIRVAGSAMIPAPPAGAVAAVWYADLEPVVPTLVDTVPEFWARGMGDFDPPMVWDQAGVFWWDVMLTAYAWEPATMNDPGYWYAVDWPPGVYEFRVKIVCFCAVNGVPTSTSYYSEPFTVQVYDD